MEKVDVDEKKRMFELMKERELGGNMDWMYRGEKPDTEEFLLGKSVDKMVAEATTADEGSGSIFSERIKANVALDMQAKMREDPLFAIRKKEEDARKRLLENPVKMKQLEKLVEQQQQQKLKAAKKGKKEKKKRKKKKGKDSDSDSDSSESEDDLVNKYLTILTQKKKSGGSADKGDHRKQHKHSGKAKEDRGDDQPHKHNDRSRYEEHGRRREEYGRRREEQGRHREEYGRHRDDRNQGYGRGPRHDRNYDPPEKRKGGDRAGRQRSDSPAEQRRKRSSSSEESEPEPHHRLQRQDSSDGEVQKKVYGLIKSVRHSMSSAEHQLSEVKHENIKRSRSSSSRSRSRSPKRSAHRKEPRRHHSSPKQHRRRSASHSRSRSPVRKRGLTPLTKRKSKSKSPSRKRQSRSPPKKKLTAEEKQRRLQEMMEDAKWRDEQRRENVQRYKEEEKKESSRLSSYQGEAGFINSMMSDHASASTVEDRLKRNKHNIQRTRAALDKNFTER